MVEATYSLTEDEFCEAVIYADRVRRPMHYLIVRWIYLTLFCVAAGLYLAGFVGFFYLQSDPRLHLSPATLILSGVLDAGVLYFLYSGFTTGDVRKFARKRFNGGRGHTNVRIRVDRSGWHDDTPGKGTMFVEWSAFEGWSENDRIFVALKHERKFHVVPKRALNAAQLNELRALVGKRM